MVMQPLFYLGPASEIFKKSTAFYAYCTPCTGRGSGPPEEYKEKRIDLNKLFNFGPSAFTAWHAQGDSMIGAGIHTGDILIVDRALQAVMGDIVIAEINRQPTVKRLGKNNNAPALLPENPNHKPIPIDEVEGIRVWGVCDRSLSPFQNLSLRPYFLQKNFNVLTAPDFTDVEPPGWYSDTPS